MSTHIRTLFTLILYYSSPAVKCTSYTLNATATVASGGPSVLEVLAIIIDLVATVTVCQTGTVGLPIPPHGPLRPIIFVDIVFIARPLLEYLCRREFCRSADYCCVRTCEHIEIVLSLLHAHVGW